jgi:hypothetical protein
MGGREGDCSEKWIGVYMYVNVILGRVKLPRYGAGTINNAIKREFVRLSRSRSQRKREGQCARARVCV